MRGERQTTTSSPPLQALECWQGGLRISRDKNGPALRHRGHTMAAPIDHIVRVWCNRRYATAGKDQGAGALLRRLSSIATARSTPAARAQCPHDPPHHSPEEYVPHTRTQFPIINLPT